MRDDEPYLRYLLQKREDEGGPQQLAPSSSHSTPYGSAAPSLYGSAAPSPLATPYGSAPPSPAADRRGSGRAIGF